MVMDQWSKEGSDCLVKSELRSSTQYIFTVQWVRWAEVDFQLAVLWKIIRYQPWMGEKKFVWEKIPQDCNLPAKSRKLFLQCIFDAKQHPSAVVYLDEDRVKLFDMLFWPRFLQLYQQEVKASTHFRAKEPACMINIRFERLRLYIAWKLAGKKYPNKWQNKNDLKHTKKQCPWSQPRLKFNGAFFLHFR